MLTRALTGVHVAAGLAAVIAGAAAMLAPKRHGAHPRRGTAYLIALAVLAATAAGIAALRPHTAYLLLPGGLALTAAATGYAARRIRWRGWLTHHITGMTVSYLAMLTAFYVDNGPRLPLWNRLPPATFWFLPTAAGLPLLLRALHHHRATAGRRSTTGPRA
jgi:hypothetical protein